MPAPSPLLRPSPLRAPSPVGTFLEGPAVELTGVPGGEAPPAPEVALAVPVGDATGRAERRLLGGLPPYLVTDPSVQGLMRCAGREVERIDRHAAWALAQLHPQTADDYGLTRWEDFLGLRRSSGQELENRRQRVVRRAQTLRSEPSEDAWVENVTARIGTGWSYEEHNPGRRTTNRVDNPSAETDLAEIVPNGSGATLGEPGATLAQTTTVAVAGRTSVRVAIGANGTGSPGVSYRSTENAYVAGEIATISAHAYGTAGGELVRLILSERDATGALLREQAGPEVTLTKGWSRLTFAGVLGDGTRRVYVKVVQAGAAVAAAYYVDGVMSTATREVTDYFDRTGLSKPDPLSPPPFTLKIRLPFAVGTPEYNQALRVIDEETPPELLIPGLGETPGPGIVVTAGDLRFDEARFDVGVIFADAFADGVLDARLVATEPANVRETAGRLGIRAHSTIPAVAYTLAQTFARVGAAVEVPVYAGAAGLSLRATATDLASLTFDGTTLRATLVVTTAGVTTTTTTTFAPALADVRWLRLASEGGSLIWQTSADGVEFSTRRLEPDPAWVATAGGTVRLSAEGTSGAFAEFDNLEIRQLA